MGKGGGEGRDGGKRERLKKTREEGEGRERMEKRVRREMQAECYFTIFFK